MNTPTPLTQAERMEKLRAALRLLDEVRLDLLFHRFQGVQMTAQATIFAVGMLEARIEIAWQAASGAIWWAEEAGGRTQPVPITAEDRAVAADGRA